MITVQLYNDRVPVGKDSQGNATHTTIVAKQFLFRDIKEFKERIESAIEVFEEDCDNATQKLVVPVNPYAMVIDETKVPVQVHSFKPIKPK